MEQTAKIFASSQMISMDHASAEAMLVADGTIQAMGSVSALQAQAPDAELIELDGVVLPGFIDAHLHPMPMIFFALSLDFREVRDFDQALRQFAQGVEPGEWITGIQFDPGQFPDIPMTRERLDSVLPAHKVAIYTRDGHGLWCNSAALDASGVDQASDPDGGRILRDADGRPTGLLLENAMRLVQKVQDLPDPARINAACDQVFHALAAQGITSFGAMFQSDAEGPGGAAAEHELMIYQALMERIPQTAYGMVMGRDLDRIAGFSNGPRLRFGGWKGFVDGTFGSSTAALMAPFEGEPDNTGLLVQPADVLYARMEAAHLRGLQICLHAIGDRGIAVACDLFGRLLAAHPRDDHRHRIEHASLCPSALIKRMADLDLVAVVQPMFVDSEMAWLPDRLGERVRDCYPFGGLSRGGVALAGSSDAPMEDSSVLRALHIMTHRTDTPDQALSVQEALAAYTAGAAYALKAPEIGQLAPGKRADFVVLNASPLTHPLRDIRVTQTYIRGACVFSEAEARP